MNSLGGVDTGLRARRSSASAPSIPPSGAIQTHIDNGTSCLITFEAITQNNASTFVLIWPKNNQGPSFVNQKSALASWLKNSTILPATSAPMNKYQIYQINNLRRWSTFELKLIERLDEDPEPVPLALGGINRTLNRTVAMTSIALGLANYVSPPGLLGGVYRLLSSSLHIVVTQGNRSTQDIVLANIAVFAFVDMPSLLVLRN